VSAGAGSSARAGAGAGGASGAAAGSGGSASTSDAIVGSFTVSLVAPTDSDPKGHTSIVGKVSDGPTPAQIVWEKSKTSGTCTLYTPRVPFCNTPCTGGAICAEDDVCQPRPVAIDVGSVQVTGVKTTAGATEFTLSAIAKNYQAPSAIELPFPAFDEGAAVQFRAEGAQAFTLAAHGIKPLTLAASTYALERGKPLDLSWTAAGSGATSSVHVKLDISHHGGSKGMIECDSADKGSLSIASELISSLLDLGVAGFPTVIATRHDDGEAKITAGRVQLIVSSQVEQAVTVPGLTSCGSADDCPEGKTCLADLTCSK
jgi:hypothetical protein